MASKNKQNPFQNMPTPAMKKAMKNAQMPWSSQNKSKKKGKGK